MIRARPPALIAAELVVVAALASGAGFYGGQATTLEQRDDARAELATVREDLGDARVAELEARQDVNDGLEVLEEAGRALERCNRFIEEAGVR